MKLHNKFSRESRENKTPNNKDLASWAFIEDTNMFGESTDQRRILLGDSAERDDDEERYINIDTRQNEIEQITQPSRRSMKPPAASKTRKIPLAQSRQNQSVERLSRGHGIAVLSNRTNRMLKKADISDDLRNQNSANLINKAKNMQEYLAIQRMQNDFEYFTNKFSENSLALHSHSGSSLNRPPLKQLMNQGRRSSSKSFMKPRTFDNYEAVNSMLANGRIKNYGNTKNSESSYIRPFEIKENRKI